MPHEVMNEQQVAAYLHLALREVRKLAARGRIRCRKVGGGFQFRKGDVGRPVIASLGALSSLRRRASPVRLAGSPDGFLIGSFCT